MKKLKYLLLVGNNFKKVTKTSFVGLALQNGSYIGVDNPSTCCFIEPSNQSQCIATDKKSPYLTCQQLLPTKGVKWCTWILGFGAFFVNMAVFIWGCQKVKTQSANEKPMKQILFITNLAAADFLIGLYLITIASVDQYYNEYFPSYAKSWRNGAFCKFAGFLSVLSSEASLLFLTLIAVDRLWAFRKAVIVHKFFGQKRLFGKRQQSLLSVFVWIIALALSITTTILNDDELYQFSDVCIGLPLVRIPQYQSKYENITITYDFDRPDEHLIFLSYIEIDSNAGNYFSIGLFLGLNFILCLTIAICYILLFIRIYKSGFALVKTDFKMAIKDGCHRTNRPHVLATDSRAGYLSTDRSERTTS